MYWVEERGEEDQSAPPVPSDRRGSQGTGLVEMVQVRQVAVQWADASSCAYPLVRGDFSGQLMFQAFCALIRLSTQT